MKKSEALSILNIPVNTPLTAEVLKSAYRVKAKETHTDRGGNVADFLAVKKAYDILFKNALVVGHNMYVLKHVSLVKVEKVLK